MTSESPTGNSRRARKKSLQLALEASSIDDFMAYVRSPWRIVWTNFLAGIFRGLGVAVGATAVLAILLWLLALARAMPIVGEFAAQLKDQIATYAEETRYSDDFDRLESVLKKIETELRQERQYRENSN